MVMQCFVCSELLEGDDRFIELHLNECNFLVALVCIRNDAHAKLTIRPCN